LAEAVNTAIYVRNRCPSKVVSAKIPEEFGGQKRKRRKLDPKSE
jgi:hypothetical protein